MAEDVAASVTGAAAAGGGAAAVVARAGPAATLPLRPPLILPPRSTFESLFRGVVAEASPGPLTLVSSFFAEDADSECGSFTQLLVGAMNSPVAAQLRGDGRADRSSGIGGAAEAGRLGGSARLEQNRPSSLAITQPQLFAVPPGLSPSGLLDSPAFFSSPLSDFRISHQEALAQVTAQAAQSQFRMLGQAESPSSFFTAAATSLVKQSVQEIPTLQSNNTTLESAEDSHSDQISQPDAAIVGKPAEDGYNWRKYGQKVVKGSEFPRSYYKCTHPNCPVKKKIERSVDGQITEIIYKGQHNHQKPPPNKRAREGGILPSGSHETNGKLDHTTTYGQGSQGHRGTSNKTNAISSCATISQKDQDPGMPDESSDSEEVAETKADEVIESESDNKRRNTSTSAQKTTTEPRIIVQTTSEVDLLDDGYRWRKYGQKVVKGNPNPRSYYKCTFGGCNVRKHVERSSTDPKAVITTYEGKHNHDPPGARNSSHNIVNVAPASGGVQSNQASIKSTKFGTPLEILQLKGEQEIT